MRNTLLALIALLVTFLLYLGLWPVPIDPEAWQPPTPDPAAWSPTGNFERVTRIEVEDGHGPEDLDVDHRGRIYGGFSDGRILRWEHAKAQPTVFANTKGRPLGLEWDAENRSLLVADAFAGLLSIDEQGTITSLTQTCAGRKLVFTDDLERASDGAIWFSDASERFPQDRWKLDMLENRPNGRLCVWRPGEKDATQVKGDLYFANGVAVDPELAFVLVNETTRYRVGRLWIAGVRKGEYEILVDNLPGFPDGISRGADGRYWIAIASPRNPLLDSAGPSPWMRKVIARLPSFMQPAPERTARAIAIDGDGKVLHHLFDGTGERIWMVTSVQERNAMLYFGSLVDNAWATVPISELGGSARL